MMQTTHFPAAALDRPATSDRPDRHKRTSFFMPKYMIKPENPTPWARVLLDFMWNQRPPDEPPLTNAQLAVRLHLSRVTVNHWIYNRVIPNLETAIDVLHTLNIPVERLIRAYDQEGIPAPPLAEHQADGHPADEQRRSTDQWDAMIQQTTSTLQDAGMDEHTIGAVIDRIRATQIGSRPPQPLAAHIAAEHASEAQHPRAVSRSEPREPFRAGPSGAERVPFCKAAI